ncbi:MAG: DUF4129 domain-containing protein [Anaerolineales bacterium]|nr:DUF4129 domain-containing protein [Anaerolineales bacterium]
MLANVKLPKINLWHEVALFGVMFMQLSWIVVWYRSLTPGTAGIPSGRAYLVFGAVLLVTTNLLRYLIDVGARETVSRVSLLVVFFGGVILGIGTLINRSATVIANGVVLGLFAQVFDLESFLPDDLVVVGFVLVIWRMGIYLANQGVGTQWVIGQFRLGVIMLAAFAVVTMLGDRELPIYAVYLFLFFGLLSMGAARIATQSRFRGGMEQPFDSSWLGGMALVISTVVVTAGLIGAIMEGQIGVWILMAVETVVAVIVLLMIGPLLLIPLLLGLINQIDPSGATETIDVAEQVQENVDDLLGVVMEIEPPKVNMIDLGDFFWPVFIIGGILLFVLILMRMVRTRKRQRLRHHQSATIYETVGLMDALLKAFRERGNRLRDRIRSARIRRADRLQAANRIRRTYGNLLDLCEELGLARPVANTPLEFQPKVEELFPDHIRDVRSITEAYVRVRYGELPEREDQVAAIENAWERIHAKGDEIIVEIKQMAKSVARAHRRF